MRNFFCILFLPIFFSSFSQEKIVASVDFSEPIIHAYIDRPGDVYLQFENNVIKKYDRDGKLSGEQKFNTHPTLFEPRDGARAFIYMRKRQEFGYFTFGSLQLQKLNEEYAVDPVLVCSSGDQGIWIFDGADLSLRRVNLPQSKVEIDFFLPEPTGKKNILSMREYQNFLFLLDDESHIFILNRVGNLLKELAGESINWFNFLGEEIYYQENGILVFTDLFDGSVRGIETDKDAKFTLFSDERKFLVYERKLVVNTFN